MGLCVACVFLSCFHCAQQSNERSMCTSTRGYGRDIGLFDSSESEVGFLSAGCRVIPMLGRQPAIVRLSIVITLINVAYLLQQAGAPLQPAVISGIGSTYKDFLHSLVDALCSCAVATVLLCAAGAVCLAGCCYIVPELM